VARAEVVVLMGVAGSGKTRLAASFAARGYVRLNRDDVGGTLKALARRLAETLEGGATRVVLDNTYLTRATRSEVVRVAHAASAAVRCVHLSTDAHDVQVNLVTRMLERHGALLGGAELLRRSKEDPNLFAPGVFHRMQRQLEPPHLDEGFSSVETVRFVRAPEPASARKRGSVAVPLEVVLQAGRHGPLDIPDRGEDDAVLVFGWQPGADEAWQRRTAEAVLALLPHRERSPVELAVCPHGAGPPVCWCRPPLPGLWLAFARRHSVDAARSTLVATTPAHHTMARTLGLRVVP
jgi:predicted kinase